MPHPISTTYLDQQTARASAALPAAGAYDTAPTEMPCPGFGRAMLYFTYTRGAAGGAFVFRVDVSPDSNGTVWYRGGLYAPSAVVGGADSQSDLQREAIEYASTGAGAETISYGPIELGGTTERLRIATAETGVPATPGTLAIRAVFAE